MNEAETRAELIDPTPVAAGWDKAGRSETCPDLDFWSNHT